MAVTKNNNPQVQNWLMVAVSIVVVIFVNVLANSRIGNQPLYTSIDLTEEKRFTLTDATKDLLRGLDDVVYARVLLEGEFPAGFKRLQTAVRETLDDFRGVSSYVEYGFEDPGEGSTQEVNDKRKELAELGMRPLSLKTNNQDEAKVQVVFPYVVFYYKGRERTVNILENEVPGVPSELILNNSVALLEYKFAMAIQKLASNERPIIAFSTGQGELAPIQTADLEKTLRENYQVGRLVLDSVVSIPQDVKALVVAKPTRPFSEKNKFKLDQYVMNGGKIMWLLDKVAVDLDSLNGRREFYPTEYDLNIDDLLFRYGVRVPSSLVLDLRNSRIPLATGTAGDAAQLELFSYPYHVLALPQSNHPIVKSLEAVNLLYPGFIDISPQTKTDIRKEILLMSSANARYQRLPVSLDFNFLRYPLDPEKFNRDSLVMAVLLEGEFASMYENRLTDENLAVLQETGVEFRALSPPGRMIVVADGDVARNALRPENQVMPLGYNPFEKYVFGNKDFMINALEYLIDATGVTQARGKEVRLRLLNTVKAKEEATKWQLINLVLPLIFLGLFGLGYHWWRRRRYTA